MIESLPYRYVALSLGLFASGISILYGSLGESLETPIFILFLNSEIFLGFFLTFVSLGIVLAFFFYYFRPLKVKFRFFF